MIRWFWGLLDWGVRYLVFLSLLLGVANPVFATPRTALVIGNGGYQEGRLRNPPNDARDMAAKLKELGFTVIDEYDADRRRMRRALRKFEDELRRSGGVGLFYFAGHGVQVKERNYLIPIGADIRREFEVPDEALESGAVLRAMQSAGNDLNIVILDACRDNPYARSFRTTTRGLARLETENTRGVFVAYATGPGQVAADGDKRNSPYTRHLLANLGTPGLPLELVFKRVRQGVYRDTGGEQLPWTSSSVLGDFYFVSTTVESKPSLKPGDVFQDALRDGTRGPEMVVIPAGEFWMGSPESEEGRDDDERRHRVRIEQDFAIGKYEVTFEEYDRFAEATGREKPDDEGWGRGRRPVINVTWNDAVAYAEWLSGQTGENYDLPTEAQWEYAARAGTQTAAYWGDNPDHACRYDNVYDRTFEHIHINWTPLDCDDGYDFTAPVGGFEANGFGLYDMLGNVYEWTCSEYEEGYGEAESICISKNHASNTRLVLRGGSSGTLRGDVRAADRIWNAPSFRSGVGFRLARSL